MVLKQMRASYPNGHEGHVFKLSAADVLVVTELNQHKCCGHPLQRGAGVNRGGVAEKGALSVLRTNSEIIHHTQRHTALDDHLHVR